MIQNTPTGSKSECEREGERTSICICTKSKHKMLLLTPKRKVATCVVPMPIALVQICRQEIQGIIPGTDLGRRIGEYCQNVPSNYLCLACIPTKSETVLLLGQISRNRVLVLEKLDRNGIIADYPSDCFALRGRLVFQQIR